jgi:predicted Zn-dependent peptidase
MKNKFYRKVLDNGMTIVLEKRNLPVVSVAFAVRNGGVNEKEEEKGISHFIEHMLYKGTPTRDAKKIAEDIEKRGGDLNGFTSEEITAYWCKMPSRHLDTALEVLSDMVKNPLFDEKELEKERKVIFEEIKMYHDNPRAHSFDEIQKLLYNGTMKINLAGTFNTMNSITRNKILSKFKEVYSPNNIILCVVGNADFDYLIKFVEKNFENEKGKITLEKFGLENDSKIEKREGIDQANIIFAYHVPLAGDKKSYAAVVLNALMAGGMSSRLFSEIREKRNLAYAVKGDSNVNKNFAYNIIYVGAMKENVEKIKKLILEEFDKVATSLEEKEVNQMKEQLVGNYQISMEDSQQQMMNLLVYEVHGNAKEFYNFEKDISKVKLEDVKKLASDAKKNYSFYALVPKE